MARRLLCALLFLQVSLMVLGDEPTTIDHLAEDEDASTVKRQESTTVKPTRSTSGAKTSPPALIHNALNGTTSLKDDNTSLQTASNSTDNKSQEEKSAAMSGYNHNIIVLLVAATGAVLSAI